MSQFSTLVPIAKLAGKQWFSAGLLARVSENEQYTYIFVHVGFTTLYKAMEFIYGLFEKWFKRGPHRGEVAEEYYMVAVRN